MRGRVQFYFIRGLIYIYIYIYFFFFFFFGGGVNFENAQNVRGLKF